MIVQCRPSKRCVQSHEVGLVGVDYARILIADVNVPGIGERFDLCWHHLMPAFWGFC